MSSGASRRRRAWLATVLASTLLLVACNLINGSHERVVDEGDASKADRAQNNADTGNLVPTDGGDGKSDADATIEDVDAGPVVISVSTSANWASPAGNGANPAFDAGVFIASLGSASHGVIIPIPQPNIPSDDYTVIAIVRCSTGPQGYAEFGVMTRVQTNGAGTFVSSRFGQDDTPLHPFMGSIQPTSWNPSVDVQGPDAGFVPAGRYRVELVARGEKVSGRMWLMADPSPPPFMALLSPFATGRGVGFYTYNNNDAVLESVQITVP